MTRVEAGLTTEEIAARLGSSFEWAEGILLQEWVRGHVDRDAATGRWRATERLVSGFGRAFLGMAGGSRRSLQSESERRTP